MIAYGPRSGISPEATKYLSQKQQTVNSIVDFASRVASGKNLWDRKSKTRFEEIRQALFLSVGRNEMCPYCETSTADEVEHIRPKDFYPETVFVYENYLMSCGACNIRKGNQYVILVNGSTQKISRSPKAPLQPPPSGKEMFIDPFKINPFDLMYLELKETFFFQAMPDLAAEAQRAAELTIEILALNVREALIGERRNAYSVYLALAREYAAPSTDQPRKSEIENTIKSMRHPTVWREMKRQRNVIPELRGLFSAAPMLVTLQ